MKPSPCRCGARAEYSVCVLVSTLRVRPRRQKCGRAEAFCATCIQKLMSGQWSLEAFGIQKSLRDAYTAIAASGTESDHHATLEYAIDREQEAGTNEPEVIR